MDFSPAGQVPVFEAHGLGAQDLLQVRPAARCAARLLCAARPRRRVYSGAAGSGGAEFLPNFVLDLEDVGNTQARWPRCTESSADRCYYFADREAEAHEQDADGDVRQDTPILRFHMHRDSI